MKLWQKVLRVIIGIITLGLSEATFSFGYSKGAADQKAAAKLALEEERRLKEKIKAQHEAEQKEATAEKAEA